MAFTSGLRFEQLQAIVIAGAEDTIRSTKGIVRDNRGKAQVVLSYQAPDPSKPTGKRQVRLTHNAEGIKYQKNMSQARRRKLIDEWRQQILEDLQSVKGATKDPTATTATLMESYINRREQIGEATGRYGANYGITHATASNLRSCLKLWRQYPLVSDVPLESLTVDTVQAAVNDMATKVGGEFIIKSVSLLRMTSLDTLGERSFLPTDGVIVPPRSHVPESKRKDGDELKHINTLTKDGIANVIDILQQPIESGDGRALGALLALSCGLRSEEVCAIQWKHVVLDGEHPHVEVRQALGAYRKDGHLYYEVKAPKSKKSNRDVPLPTSTCNTLKRFRAKVLEELMMTTPKDGQRVPIDNVFVCGDVFGKYTNTSVIRKWWGCFRKKHDIIGSEGDYISLHNLRDSYASRLCDEGVPLARVSRLLGHSNVTVTASRYISADRQGLYESIEMYGDLFSPKSSDEPEDNIIAL